MGGPEMGTFEKYDGPSGALVGESPWFTYADIVGDEMIVVIEEVRARKGVKFHQGKAKSVEMFLKFVGHEKELRVGATIRRQIDRLHTTNTGNWPGKALALFVQDGIKVQGEDRMGVRVRDKRVDPPEPAWTKKAALEELMRPENRAATKKACEALGIKVEKSGDLLALTDAQVHEIEKAVDAATPREAGSD